MTKKRVDFIVHNILYSYFRDFIYQCVHDTIVGKHCINQKFHEIRQKNRNRMQFVRRGGQI